MKKFLFTIISIFCCTLLSAQSADKYYMYGVDFSHAKVYAASESTEELARAFEAINLLFITEPDKYNFSYMAHNTVKVMIEPMIDKLSTCDYSELKTLTDSYEDCDYASIVESYTLPQTTGTGMVFIAKLLNKPMAVASYELITFDIATRKIISQREVEGKAKGFGLRNYWAHTIFNIIRE